MKTYPSISGPHSAQNDLAYAFVKYDGSNIRAEWSKKRGWYKFGTRKTMLDVSHPIYGFAVTQFLEKYGDALPKVFTTKKPFQGVDSVVVFAEWFGAQSFSGAHKPWDTKDIVLFDVNTMKKGMLGPKEFIDLFGHLKVAEVVWNGIIDEEFVQAVRKEEIDITSKFDVRPEIPEGVVCKGGTGHRLWMVKIKTERYKDALKKIYEKDWTLYWE